ncbi:MAG: fumarylacetoacetate hydrolase family protein [Solirubrobacteraceae bacterium]
MQLATFLPPRAQRPLAGEVRGEHIVAFAGGASVRDLLALDALEPAGGRSWPLAEVRLLAPVPDPIAVYGIGLNYAAHAAETGAELPEVPIVFAKVAGSVAPPDGPIRCPEVVRRLDYEGELCVVMGAAGRIAGYAVADDVSGRDLQRREPHWVRAKGADTFCPYGPWITTVDEVPDPQALRLRTWVNGDLRQDSSTSDMVFGPPELADFIGQTCTLHPGDLILTGTPSGVGMASGRFLTDGDVVRIEIEKLGVIEHEVSGIGSQASGTAEPMA